MPKVPIPTPIYEMSPAISIILPFFNPGKDFKAALQSVFAQTFTNWELLLMDDGSTDGSLAFAQSIDDPRVRVFSDGQSLRLNRRLNMLIDLVSAPYIARMDADDLMDPNRLELQYNVLRQYDENTVIGTGTYSIDMESRVTGMRVVREKQAHGWASTRSVLHATMLAPTSWFQRFRYSEDPVFHRAEDAELFFRSSPHTRFINIPRPLYFYRERGNFSIGKYIASMTAMILLSTRLAEASKLTAFRIGSIHTAKIWVALLAWLTGKTELLTAHRSKPVDATLAADGQRVIEYIESVTLPICGTHLTDVPVAFVESLI